MYTQNAFKDVMNALLEPIGVRARIFVVDYRDDSMNYFHVENTVAGNYPDDAVTANLIQTIEAKGFTVCDVFEILDGYDNSQLEAMSRQNPQEAAKHARLLYLDEKECVPA